MSLIMKHPWPGNVRELENVIQRAVVLAEQDVLLPEHLPGSIVTGLEFGHLDPLCEGFSLKEAQRRLEKKLIVKALTETGGNRSRAARLLEISHPSLLSKIKTYRIDL
jgi:two-component system response regulator AtoC